MKVLILLFACLALVSALSPPFELRHGLPPPPPADRQARAAVLKTFIARQDNFDPFNQNTWKMRVIENNQFFRPGGPIFIMLGAEWTIDPGYVRSGLMFDMARQHGGAMYYTEHRYYGQSFPVNDLSTENLRFLTTEQALEDVANFIRTLKQNPNFQNSRVVVAGGSYGGNLAIWMRSQYPDLVYAAWSSSAPVLAKVDFFEFSEIVSQSLAQCSDIIRNGVQEVQRLLQITGGAQKVSRDFNICHTLDVNNFGDTSYFFMTIFGKFAGPVQYGTTPSLRDLCNRLDNPNYASDYNKLVAFYRTSTGCVGDYNNLIAFYTQTGLNKGNGRQWTYQTCTEYGFFQTSTSPHQPFAGMPVEIYHMKCRDIFGINFTPQLVHAGVAAKNQRYGGLNPVVTRVISTHGTYDPWHALGLNRDVNNDAPVIIIPNAGHCADMGSYSVNDTQPMKDAKIRIQREIANWLSR